MEKLAAWPQLAHGARPRRRLRETLALVAREKGTDVRDVLVMILNRPRHEDAVREIREASASLSWKVATWTSRRGTVRERPTEAILNGR